MKTKDFIIMLQKADPSGENHIRMEGGPPIFAELKPGYWDGSYSYIEDGKFVFSTQGNKVDIWTKSCEDFIIDQITTENCDDENLWETLSSKVIDYTHNNHKEKRLEEIKIEFDFLVNQFIYVKTKAIQEAESDYDKGWTYFQSIEKHPLCGFDWIILDENNKSQDTYLKNKYHFAYTDNYEAVDNGVKKGYKQWLRKTK